MDCPADPSNLVYGVYDKMGRDLTKEKQQRDPAFWALTDTPVEDPIETPFDIKVDQNYGFF